MNDRALILTEPPPVVFADGEVLVNLVANDGLIQLQIQREAAWGFGIALLNADNVRAGEMLPFDRVAKIGMRAPAAGQKLGLYEVTLEDGRKQRFQLDRKTASVFRQALENALAQWPA